MQQGHRAGRGVQAHRVADAGVFGRVGREDQGHPLVGGGDLAQPCVPDRQARDPGAALRVGHIGDQPVVVNLLERERNRDDAAVELGHRHLAGHVQRRQAVVVGAPLIPRASQTQALQDRDVQRRQVLNVPAVIVAAGRGGGRLDSPAASTVTTMASAPPSLSSSRGSAVRSDAQ